MSNYLDLSIQELRQLLRDRKISVVDLVQESLDQIKTHNSKLNCFITVQNKKTLLNQAQTMDKQGLDESKPLWGIPFSVKDAYVTTDMRTTAASKILDGFTSPYTSTAVQKTLDAGAVLIGKNNQDAWGHGGSNENSDFLPCRNPWDTNRISGGSSGGSAVAVSSRMVAFAIGEDTGGSIRNPSSMCNISGLKVTYGRVSRYGAIAYASSLDTVGPMAKSAADLAEVLTVIAGKDSHDATSSSRLVPNYVSDLAAVEMASVTLGIPKEFFGEGLDSEVKKIVESAIKVYQDLGAKIIEVSLPLLPYAVAIYYLIAASETSSNLSRYDGVRFGQDRSNFSPETARRILLGSYALSAGYADELYNKAQQARTALIHDYQKAFNKATFLLSPVLPYPPQPVGKLINNPLQNMLSDLYTVTTNIVGVPAIALPAGLTQNNLPVGHQLTGRKFEEAALLAVGNSYQQATNWHVQKPPL